MNFFMNLTTSFIMKSTVLTIFLIFFLGGAYYMGMRKGIDKSQEKIEEHKQSIDDLNAAVRSLQKEKNLLQDSIKIFRDSIHRIDLEKSKLKDKEMKN